MLFGADKCVLFIEVSLILIEGSTLSFHVQGILIEEVCVCT